MLRAGYVFNFPYNMYRPHIGVTPSITETKQVPHGVRKEAVNRYLRPQPGVIPRAWSLTSPRGNESGKIARFRNTRSREVVRGDCKRKQRHL